MRVGLPEMDVEFTIKSLHKAGVLGGLLSRIGKTEALVGDISTTARG